MCIYLVFCFDCFSFFMGCCVLQPRQGLQIEISPNGLIWYIYIVFINVPSQVEKIHIIKLSYCTAVNHFADV